MMKPFTEMRRPGPSSRGRLENKARRATALELMFERREERRDMPSLVVEVLVAVEVGAGASGSVGSWL